MKAPKKPISQTPKGKPSIKKENTDEEFDDVQDEKVTDEDEDDFELPLDDLETFDSFDDDDEDDF